MELLVGLRSQQPDSLFQLSDYLHAVATPDGLKFQEYVEELVERPPIKEVLRVG